MANDRQTELTAADRQDALIAAYEEISESYRTSSDTRLKLAGIVPVATGVVIALLLNTSSHGPRMELFLPVGLLGLLTTVGIYVYDLRQLHSIYWCIKLGKEAEGKLEVQGLFGRPRRRYRLQPTFVFYSVVAAVWAFIACIGLNPALAWGAALLAFGISFIVALYSYQKLQDETRPEEPS